MELGFVSRRDSANFNPCDLSSLPGLCDVIEVETHPEKQTVHRGTSPNDAAHEDSSANSSAILQLERRRNAVLRNISV